MSNHPELAQFYLKRARQTVEVVPGPLAEFYLGRASDSASFRSGNWKEAADIASSALEWTFRIGDKRVEAESAAVVVSQALFAGNFKRAHEATNILESLGASTRDDGILAWALIWRSFLTYWQDDYAWFAQCIARLDQLTIPEDGASQDSQLILKAYYLWRERRLPEARAAIQEAVEALETLGAALFHYYQAISELARTCVMMAEQEQYAESMHAYGLRLTRVLRKMMRFFPFAAPAYELYGGLVAWSSNRPQQAHRLWQKSLKAARKWHMPYDEARALYEIGCHLPASDPGREQNLKAAAAIFERLGANLDMKLTQAQLKNRCFRGGAASERGQSPASDFRRRACRKYG